MFLKTIIRKKDGKLFYKLGINGYYKGLKVCLWRFISEYEFNILYNIFKLNKKVFSNNCITYFVSSYVIEDFKDE